MGGRRDGRPDVARVRSASERRKRGMGYGGSGLRGRLISSRAVRLAPFVQKTSASDVRNRAGRHGRPAGLRHVLACRKRRGAARDVRSYATWPRRAMMTTKPTRMPAAIMIWRFTRRFMALEGFDSEVRLRTPHRRSLACERCEGNSDYVFTLLRSNAGTKVSRRRPGFLASKTGPAGSRGEITPAFGRSGQPGEGLPNAQQSPERCVYPTTVHVNEAYQPDDAPLLILPFDFYVFQLTRRTHARTH